MLEEKFRAFGSQAVVLGLWRPELGVRFRPWIQEPCGADAAVKQDSVHRRFSLLIIEVIIAPKGAALVLGTQCLCSISLSLSLAFSRLCGRLRMLPPVFFLLCNERPRETHCPLLQLLDTTSGSWRKASPWFLNSLTATSFLKREERASEIAKEYGGGDLLISVPPTKSKGNQARD